MINVDTNCTLVICRIHGTSTLFHSRAPRVLSAVTVLTVRAEISLAQRRSSQCSVGSGRGSVLMFLHSQTALFLRGTLTDALSQAEAGQADGLIGWLAIVCPSPSS